MENGIVITQDGAKWHASPVVSYKGSFEGVRGFVPYFERRSFGPGFLPLAPPDQPSLLRWPGNNPNLNAIVRLPLIQSEHEVPVGIVSSNYTLLQHHDLFDEVAATLKSLGIKLDEVVTEARLTEYGERMQLSLLFPERFSLKLKDGDSMGLRLECFNSVEGSMKFTAIIGWLRFVCSNGLVVGIADTYYRQRHNRDMELKEISSVLKSGIDATTRERETYLRWQKKRFTETTLSKWVNGPLMTKWGVKAATRTWHITREGYDVVFADPFEKAKPTEKTVVRGDKVPGAVLPGDNVFAVVQALSWLAKERRDVQEQLVLKQQIPDLARALIGKSS